MNNNAVLLRTLMIYAGCMLPALWPGYTLTNQRAGTIYNSLKWLGRLPGRPGFQPFYPR
jgi:hypothetical protein